MAHPPSQQSAGHRAPQCACTATAREELLPTSGHSNKLIQGRPTDARRLEPYTEGNERCTIVFMRHSCGTARAPVPPMRSLSACCTPCDSQDSHLQATGSARWWRVSSIPACPYFAASSIRAVSAGRPSAGGRHTSRCGLPGRMRQQRGRTGAEQQAAGGGQGRQVQGGRGAPQHEPEVEVHRALH